MSAHGDVIPKPHHDIESFFWVVFFSAIKRFTPNWKDEEVEDALASLFDEALESLNRPRVFGGGFKQAELAYPRWVKKLPEDTLLRPWIEKGRVPLDAWQTVGPTNDDAAMKAFADIWENILNANNAKPTTGAEQEQLEANAKRVPSHVFPATRTASLHRPTQFDTTVIPVTATLTPQKIFGPSTLLQPSKSAPGPPLGHVTTNTEQAYVFDEEMDSTGTPSTSDSGSVYVPGRRKTRRGGTSGPGPRQTRADTKKGKGTGTGTGKGKGKERAPIDSNS